MGTSRLSPAGANSAASASAKPLLPGQRNVSLPTAKSVPSEEFSDYHWLLYGERKIGKTTLAAEFPDAFFLMFEPGGKALSVFQREVQDWLEFRAYVDLLKSEDGAPFRTVVVDTVDILYEQCLRWVCEKNRIDHPGGQNDYGKSWSLVKQEFSAQVNRLMRLGKGVIFISHAKISEIKPRVGATYNKIVPTMTNQAFEVIYPAVDVIAFYNYFGNERRLVIRGNELIGAGNRFTDHFYTTDNKQIVSIKMGANAKEAYANVREAFANKSDFVGDDIKLVVDAAMPNVPRPSGR